MNNPLPAGRFIRGRYLVVNCLVMVRVGVALRFVDKSCRICGNGEILEDNGSAMGAVVVSEDELFV